MTPQHLEIIRHWLYPFGFVSALFFGLRFLVQWWASEHAGKSIVPKIFWKLSLFGNISLMLHSFIQLQFPMYLLQSQHIVISWRNCNLMKKKPKSLKFVFFLLCISAFISTAIFILHQLYFFQTIIWIRNPTLLSRISNWKHIIGTIGIIAFSLRFWIQWWEAEQAKKSVLSKHFWYISVFGSITCSFYFITLHDWVNMVGPIISFIPYCRNLMLITKHKKPYADIVLLASETSADQLGQQIVEQLQKKYPTYTFAGIAGRAMRKQGVFAWLHMESFQVMGLIDVIKKLPFLIYAMYQTRKWVSTINPRIVICIDQPSFSLALAKRLKKHAFTGKLIQVVAPTVWAYKPERAQAFAKYFDAILPLFKFETEFFKNIVPTTWIGHPFLQQLQPTSQPKQDRIALFPGSRPGEVRRNLPLQIQTAVQLQKKYPNIQVSISVADSLGLSVKKWIAQYAQQSFTSYECIDFSQRYELMARTKVAIAKLGTITLELALHNVPCVCCYQVHAFTHWWAQKFLQLKPQFFALPNILANEKVIPECVLPPVYAHDLQKEIEPYFIGTKKLPSSLLSILQQQINPGSKTQSIIADAISQILEGTICKNGGIVQ